MTSKGLLLVTMEPPAGFEDEFNDWYDTEHFPQRRALPGFETATRWVCLTGWPRWLALYDLVSIAAVETPEYKAVSGSNSTPWSRRILPRTVGRERIVAEQMAPGQALRGVPDAICHLLLARYPVSGATDVAGVVSHLGKAKDALDGLSQLRVFRGATPIGGAEVWAIAEFARPVTTETLGGRLGVVAGIGARQFNLYAPYRRG
ncbi:MAG TPA: hypothetical protein VNT30_06875 [Stellaceae bacterium]|nr:hypothetical protein [Stellaceae bacterium]